MRRLRDRILVYTVALMVSLWILIPIALMFIAAFSDKSEYYRREVIIPRVYTTDNIEVFLRLGGLEALYRSFYVAILTIAITMALATPAGYAIGRYLFRGRDALKLAYISFRVVPVVVIAVPLTRIYLSIGLHDSLLGIALVHTALALPFAVLITSSVFAGIPRDLEEAGLVFGMSRLQVALRITLPMALPGLVAAAMFTFIISYNEVFAATVLALTQRTLPAFVLAAIGGGTAGAMPDPLKFAATVFLVVPAFLIMAYMRRYITVMWGYGR